MCKHALTLSALYLEVPRHARNCKTDFIWSKLRVDLHIDTRLHLSERKKILPNLVIQSHYSNKLLSNTVGFLLLIWVFFAQYDPHDVNCQENKQSLKRKRFFKIRTG